MSQLLVKLPCQDRNIGLAILYIYIYISYIYLVLNIEIVFGIARQKNGDRRICSKESASVIVQILKIPLNIIHVCKNFR